MKWIYEEKPSVMCSLGGCDKEVSVSCRQSLRFQVNSRRFGNTGLPLWNIKTRFTPIALGSVKHKLWRFLEVSVLYLFLEEEFLFYLRLCKGSDRSPGQS